MGIRRLEIIVLCFKLKKVIRSFKLRITFFNLKLRRSLNTENLFPSHPPADYTTGNSKHHGTHYYIHQDACHAIKHCSSSIHETVISAIHQYADDDGSRSTTYKS